MLKLIVKKRIKILCSKLLLLSICGRIGQSVMCLTTDAYLTADPGQGVLSSILAWSHTLEETDHEIISMVILLPQEGLLSVTSECMCTKHWLTT